MVAVLGICGTLAAAVITQRGVDRARAREWAHTRQLQQDERKYATRHARLEARRTCCATLSAGARDQANVMARFLHPLEKGEVTEELRSDLDRARREHRLRHAEAQMVLPDTVAQEAGTANRHLGHLYGLLMRLDAATPQQGESVETAWVNLDEVWEPLFSMRRVMRVDLGVTPPDRPS